MNRLTIEALALRAAMHNESVLVVVDRGRAVADTLAAFADYVKAFDARLVTKVRRANGLEEVAFTDGGWVRIIHQGRGTPNYLVDTVYVDARDTAEARMIYAPCVKNGGDLFFAAPHTIDADDTVAPEHTTDTSPAFSAALAAWNVPGPAPELHEREKRRLYRDWPALAVALDRASAHTWERVVLGAGRA